MNNTNSTDERSQSQLGGSQPLVSIPGAPIAMGLAVPAGNDHPLAVSAPPTPPPPPVAQLPPPPVPPPPAAPAPAFSTPQRPPAPAPPAANETPVASSGSLHLGAISPSVPLDAIADSFLSDPSYRTRVLGLSPILHPTPLPREDGIRRLRTLVSRRAWGDVLKIASGMLHTPNSPYADVYSSLIMMPLNAPQVDVSSLSPQVREETTEVMALQCHAWLKLRRYSDLSSEIERWNFLVQNDATAQSPDWMPWNLHILAGQMLQFTEDSESASDTLFALRERIPAEDALGRLSVDHALTNMFLRQMKWRLALGSLDRMMDLLPFAISQYLRQSGIASRISLTEEEERIFTVACRCELLSRQGRTFLQLGGMPQSASLFASAKDLWESSCGASPLPASVKSFRVVNCMPAILEMNQGLYLFAQSQYERSKEAFTQAVEVLRTRQPGGIVSSAYDKEDWVGPVVAAPEMPITIYSECVNNMALCSLYACQIKQGVQGLEELVREDPTAYLTERVAFNLCTLYELGADSGTSNKRKRALQLIAKRFFLHDIGPESFRVA
eukprot:Nitzschia sp. Nitz4//scaffold128_size63911//27553//29308//NITZ4_006219-RA/size63911-processed-gene-0.33-mRNA-1//-1//CDS//3329534832//3855//frame0